MNFKVFYLLSISNGCTQHSYWNISSSWWWVTLCWRHHSLWRWGRWALTYGCLQSNSSKKDNSSLDWPPSPTLRVLTIMFSQVKRPISRRHNEFSINGKQSQQAQSPGPTQLPLAINTLTCLRKPRLFSLEAADTSTQAPSSATLGVHPVCA